ncbi:hypothetical protein FHG87_003455, partial [Trinorchestia longiramus]
CASGFLGTNCETPTAGPLLLFMDLPVLLAIVVAATTFMGKCLVTVKLAPTSEIHGLLIVLAALYFAHKRKLASKNSPTSPAETENYNQSDKHLKTLAGVRSLKKCSPTSLKNLTSKSSPRNVSSTSKELVQALALSETSTEAHTMEVRYTASSSTHTTLAPSLCELHSITSDLISPEWKSNPNLTSFEAVRVGCSMSLEAPPLMAPRGYRDDDEKDNQNLSQPSLKKTADELHDKLTSELPKICLVGTADELHYKLTSELPKICLVGTADELHYKLTSELPKICLVGTADELHYKPTSELPKICLVGTADELDKKLTSGVHCVPATMEATCMESPWPLLQHRTPGAATSDCLESSLSKAPQKSDSDELTRLASTSAERTRLMHRQLPSEGPGKVGSYCEVHNVIPKVGIQNQNLDTKSLQRSTAATQGISVIQQEGKIQR